MKGLQASPPSAQVREDVMKLITKIRKGIEDMIALWCLAWPFLWLLDTSNFASINQPKTA